MKRFCMSLGSINVLNGVVCAPFLACAVLVSGVLSLKPFHTEICWSVMSLEVYTLNGKVSYFLCLPEADISLLYASVRLAYCRRYLCLGRTVKMASGSDVTWRIVPNYRLENRISSNGIKVSYLFALLSDVSV
jgi:hypothetical protein